jgi:hypothetical protein
MGKTLPSLYRPDFDTYCGKSWPYREKNFFKIVLRSVIPNQGSRFEPHCCCLFLEQTALGAPITSPGAAISSSSQLPWSRGPPGWTSPQAAGPIDRFGDPVGWPSFSVAPTTLVPFRIFVAPIWIFAIALGLLPLGWLIARVTLGHRRQSAGLCRHCGYDLRGAGARCPECGRFTRTKKHWNRKRVRMGRLPISTRSPFRPEL